MLYHAPAMDVLAPLLVSGPVWIVLLIGIALAVLTLPDHLEVSVLAIIAFLGFLVLDLVGTLVWATREWMERAPAGVEGWIELFFSVQTIFHAVFVGFAVAAAVYGRGRAE